MCGKLCRPNKTLQMEACCPIYLIAQNITDGANGSWSDILLTDLQMVLHVFFYKKHSEPRWHSKPLECVRKNEDSGKVISMHTNCCMMDDAVLFSS